MTDITTAYLDEHRAGIHTAESWARAISELIFNAAGNQLAKAASAEVTVAAEFKLSAFEPAGCIRVCGTINGVTVCYHVNT